MRQRLIEQGRKSLNEQLIFKAYAQMREITATAKRTTKAARREEQRRRNHAQVEFDHQAEAPQATGSDAVDDISKLEPFEVEEM